MELLKKTLWLSDAVWFLYFFLPCQYGCQCCSWVLSSPLCYIYFSFSLRSSTLAFCLTSHHVKTQPTTDLSLFIDFIIVGLILYSAVLKAEQHKVLLFLLKSGKQHSLLRFQVAVYRQNDEIMIILQLSVT